MRSSITQEGSRLFMNKLKHWTLGGFAAAMLVIIAVISSVAGPAAQAESIGSIRNASRDSANSLAPHVAQDPEGNVHVVWDSQEGARIVRYAKGIWNGSNYDFAGSSVIADASGSQAPSPSVAVAPNGTIMLGWSAPDGLYIRTWDSRASSPGGSAVRLGSGIQSSISADSSNRFHIAWNGDFKIQYCQWDGSNCTKRDAWSNEGEGINRPDIAVDSNDNVHVVYDRGQAVRYRNRPAGGDWGGIDEFSSGNAAQIAADAQGSVHIVWSNDYNIQYCRRTLTAGCADAHTLDASLDLSPSVGATRGGSVLVVFRDDSDDKRLWVAARERGSWSSPRVVAGGPTPPDVSARSYTNRLSAVWSLDYEAQHLLVTVAEDAQPPTATPAPPPPTATPTPIPGPTGQLMVAQEFRTLVGMPGTDATLNVVVTSTGGPASTLRLTVDGVPRNDVAFTPDAEGKMTIPLDNLNLTRACEEKTVTGVLTGPGGTSAPFSASIFVDSAVDATVEVRNPHLFGDQQPGSAGAQLAPEPADFGPVTGGEPGYTRDGYFDLNVRSRSDECAGLKSVAVDFESIPGDGTNPAPSSDNLVFVTGEIVPITFPSILEGVYTFKVIVKDLAGNAATYPATGVYSIVYDSTPPVVTLNATGQVAQTGGSTGIATLSLDGLAVRDELYPNAASTANDEYSGYWVVVKNQSDGVPTDTEWLGSGHVVRSKLAGSPPQLVWNVGLGMVGPFQAGAEYQLYVRFLDGAGNASDKIIASVPFQVDSLQITRVMLPLFTR